MSLSATCDEGGEEKLMKKEVWITCKGKIILKGTRDASIRLWLVLIGKGRIFAQLYRKSNKKA